MLYFSEDGKTMQVEYYSTDKMAYFLENSQFTLTLDLVDAEKTEETTEAPESEQVTTAPTPEQTNAPEQTTAPTEEKKGCGATASLALIPLICLAFPLIGKKERE